MQYEWIRVTYKKEPNTNVVRFFDILKEFDKPL
jgi:hypothetical protein